MNMEANNSATGLGPGSMLRRARVEQGLSTDEVAERLHLAPRQIDCLETDQFSELPGPTYIRGYLRSYATILGIPTGPLLEAYAKASGTRAAPSFSRIAPAGEITSQHSQVKLATYGVIAVIVGLAVAWWQGRESSPPPVANTEPVPAESPLLDVQPSDTAPLDPTAALLPGSPVAPGAMSPAPSAAPTPEAASPVPSPSPAPSPAPGPTASVEPPTAVREPPSNPTTRSAPTPRAEEPTANLPPPEIQPAGPRAKLTIHADEESWVDVRDARQNRLLYETVAAGRTVSLEGPAPLSVFLGNVAGVRVEFNGQPYNAKRHQRGQIARFTLGENLSDN